jgi:hypothetical protein
MSVKFPVRLILLTPYFVPCLFHMTNPPLTCFRGYGEWSGCFLPMFFIRVLLWGAAIRCNRSGSPAVGASSAWEQNPGSLMTYLSHHGFHLPTGSKASLPWPNGWTYYRGVSGLLAGGGGPSVQGSMWPMTASSPYTSSAHCLQITLWKAHDWYL